MNGAECGKCGYITCQCDRIAREAEKTKDKTIKELQAALQANDEEIDRLTDRNKALSKVIDELNEENKARFKSVLTQQNNLTRLQAEIKAKDEEIAILKQLCDEIDPTAYDRRKKALKGATDGKEVQS